MSNPAQAANYRLGQLLLMVTAIGWGLNWTVLKFVLQDWPPLFARGTAGMIGALALAAVALRRGESFAVPRSLRLRLCVAAGTNVFAWMGFTALALNWLKVSEGALIAYSMPLWAMLMAWPLRGERPTMRSLAALALGLAGLLVLMGGPELAAGKLPGILFALGAAVLFAFGTVTSRMPVTDSPTAMTAWHVALGCLPMVLLGLWLEAPAFGALSLPGAVGLAYMALGPMALCYLTWFGALQRLPASVAATGMLLVPIIGALSAIPILGDSLGSRELIAIVLTLSGVALALRRTPPQAAKA